MKKKIEALKMKFFEDFHNALLKFCIKSFWFAVFVIKAETQKRTNFCSAVKSNKTAK